MLCSKIFLVPMSKTPRPIGKSALVLLYGRELRWALLGQFVKFLLIKGQAFCHDGAFVMVFDTNVVIQALNRNHRFAVILQAWFAGHF